MCIRDRNNGGNLESAIRQYKRHRPIKLPNFLSQPRRRERDSSGYRSPVSILTKKYPNGSEWRQVSSGRRNYPTSSKGGQSFSNIGSTLSSVGRQRTRNWVKTQKPILKTPSPPGSGSSTTQTYRGKNGSGNSKVTFKEPFTPPSGSSSIIPPSGTGVSTVQQVAAEAALNSDQSCITPMVDAFKERHRFVVNAFNEIKGIKCIDAKGAFYSFPYAQEAINKLFNDGKLKENNKLFRIAKSSTLEFSTIILPFKSSLGAGICVTAS